MCKVEKLEHRRSCIGRMETNLDDSNSTTIKRGKPRSGRFLNLSRAQFFWFWVTSSRLLAQKSWSNISLALRQISRPEGTRCHRRSLEFSSPRTPFEPSRPAADATREVFGTVVV